MKLVSWNVNGIRAVLKKGFLDYVKESQPDILCLQETKAHPDQVHVVLPGYEQHWNWAEKKGYSGTAIFTKKGAISMARGIGQMEHDQEGRVITLDMGDFYLVNVYVPNSQRGLLRLEYRQKWDSDFLAYLKKLEKKKPVIYCGDLNVAHTEIDLKNPKPNKKNAGFTPEERSGFQTSIDSGFIDTFRHFNSEPENYTWWSYMHNARARNIGWRIDYFMTSQKLKQQLKSAHIHPDILGSDHCPVSLILK
jgi:exodeoxyribonuclease III